MLGLANSLARNNVDRAAVELAAVEERARLASAMVRTKLPEPQQLLDARQQVQTNSKSHEALRARLDQITNAETSLTQPRPWWRRTLDWLTGAALRRQTEIDTLVRARKQAEAAFRQAGEALSQAQRVLNGAEARHAEATREYRVRWAREAANSSDRIEAAKAAADLWRALPGLSNLGMDGMCRIGSAIAEMGSPGPRQGHTGGIPSLSPR